MGYREGSFLESSALDRLGQSGIVFSKGFGNMRLGGFLYFSRTQGLMAVYSVGLGDASQIPKVGTLIHLVLCKGKSNILAIESEASRHYKYIRR